MQATNRQIEARKNIAASAVAQARIDGYRDGNLQNCEKVIDALLVHVQGEKEYAVLFAARPQHAAVAEYRSFRYRKLRRVAARALGVNVLFGFILSAMISALIDYCIRMVFDKLANDATTAAVMCGPPPQQVPPACHLCSSLHLEESPVERLRRVGSELDNTVAAVEARKALNNG